MLEFDSDVVVMRSVYISKKLDDEIRSVAFQQDVGESELIAKLLSSSLLRVQTLKVEPMAAMVGNEPTPADVASKGPHQQRKQKRRAA